jgi:DNA (cytosine-5)-methyltransferase 1
MKLLDLFSGIGGFSLAASWLGWETVQFVEWDSFCQKVLKHHWPNVPIHSDIKTFNATHLHGTIDIISGGFPCQPYSLAGKRKGKDDDRHLWPEMLRTIREVQPSWVVGENVYGIVNWSGGLVFDEVQADLENEGYEVQPYILPACAVNAPHRRDRTWFVAYSDSNEHSFNREMRQERGPQQFNRSFVPELWDKKIESATIAEYDGIPEGLDGITIQKWSELSNQRAGNAIVPQVAYQIFKAIESYDSLHHHTKQTL